MVYLALWLILGCVGYMLALAIQLERLAARVHNLEHGDKKKWHTKADYARGLSGILLGPLCIVLVFFLNEKLYE